MRNWWEVPDRAIDLSEVTKALQQLDPVWEVLYPEERSRVLELLAETASDAKFLE